MSAPSGRPRAETFQVQRLVEQVLRGEVRIPPFQRLFRWGPDDVLDLLDSVYRGFPIGSLLLWKKPAQAAGVDLGPVHIDAPAFTDALWVVDGQQRLTSLVAVLCCPSEVPPDHRMFEVFFDLSPGEREVGPHARSGRFLRRPPGAPLPPAWLPMNVIIRPDSLDDWIDAHLSDKELRKQARLASTAFREYDVPAYIVTAGDEQVVVTMFDRTNNTGKRLEKAEVFNALHGGGAAPADLRELTAALSPLRFGDIDPTWLLKILFALRDKDVTSIKAKGLRNLPQEELRGALSDTQRALERAIVFLRRDADIPHLVLLPYRFPLLILARFFHSYPAPSPRSRALLARWVWAGAVTGEHSAQAGPYLRQALKAMRPEKSGEIPDEEEVVQRLLAMVSWAAPWGASAVDLGDFRFGTAQARLYLAALAALRPLSLVDGAPLDPGSLLAQWRGAAVPVLLPPAALQADERRIQSRLASRMIHPPLGEGPPLYQRLMEADGAVLRSHGFDAPAISALRAGDVGAMLASRQRFLASHVQQYLDRHARWAESRRKSLRAIMGPGEGEANEG